MNAAPTMLQRLLKYPHAAVFDAQPVSDLALRVRHADGASWVVADEVLTVHAGSLERSYRLGEHTFGSLAQALVADGFDVPTLAQEWAQRSALATMEESGDQGLSNGDHIHAFTSLLWVLLSGYAVEMRDAELQVVEALQQMFIPTADADWLDLWATLYGVLRKPGESDEDVRDRIPKEAFRVRVNGLAIEDAIKDITDEDIELREPWREIFRLDESKLSGNHHFADGYYSYFLVQPVARRGGVNWPGVLDVIHRNRAAGIEVYAPVTDFGPRYVVGEPPLEYIVDAATGSSRAIFVPATGEAPLGLMRLDDNEFTINHLAQVSQLRTLSNAIGLEIEQSIGVPRNVALASITLSDGMELGNENAILSRGEVRRVVNPKESLSDHLKPSDYTYVRSISRVESISLSSPFALIEYPIGEIEVGSATTWVRPMSSFVAWDDGRSWTGNWDTGRWYSDLTVVGADRSDRPVGDVLNDTLLLNVSIIN